MKQKTKKVIYKALKIIWFVLGGLVLLSTLLFLIKMNTINGWESIGAAIFFILGIYALAIYLIITLLFLLIKWLIKKIKSKK